MLGILSVSPKNALAPSRRLKVLIGDDDRDTVSTLRILLQTEGHHVRGVHRSADVMGSERDFRQLSRIAGFDYYLTKPYAIDDLLSLIHAKGWSPV